MTVEEVMEAARVGRNAAYQIIKKLNAELEAMGKLTFRGRVNRNFFKKKSAMIAERLVAHREELSMDRKVYAYSK